MRRETMRSILVGLLMLAWSVPAVAQTQLGTGALSGMVKDDSDAAVAGALVTIVNVANGLTRKTASGPAGAFTVPVLPPGLYLATVTKAGFATWKADDVEVNVGGATTLAVTLRTGAPCPSVVMGVHKPDGTLTWITLNAQPLFREGEAVPYAVVSTFSDISRRKQLEEELRQARAELASVRRSC